MAPEYVSFLQAVFLFIELVIYKFICNTLIVIARLMIKNETSTTIYYHGTKQKCYENDSKEILSVYFRCLLSVLLPMLGSTLLLNIRDSDVWKF